MRQYEKLLADLHDLAVIAARREEEPVSLEEVGRRLQEKESTGSVWVITASSMA
jgi:L-amino acid N-acyltransferase YncA